jgi:hypothetical protein
MEISIKKNFFKYLCIDEDERKIVPTFVMLKNFISYLQKKVFLTIQKT